MAQTYTVGEALSIVGGQTGRRLEDSYAAYIANMAQNVIWNKYDWRETISELPPFYLVPQTQEYGAPAVIIPANFLGLRSAFLVSTLGRDRCEMKILRDVRRTNAEGLPGVIGYDPAKAKFLVYPRFPAGFGATDWIVNGTYKKRPTKITPSTFQTTLVPWDDLYFNVYVAACKWAALETAGDQRAGQVMEQAGNYRMTGQLAVMHEAIDRMASDEGLNLGDPSIAPAEPLVGYNDGFSSLGSF